MNERITFGKPAVLAQEVNLFMMLRKGSVEGFWLHHSPVPEVNCQVGSKFFEPLRKWCSNSLPEDLN